MFAYIDLYFYLGKLYNLIRAYAFFYYFLSFILAQIVSKQRTHQADQSKLI